MIRRNYSYYSDKLNQSAPTNLSNCTATNSTYSFGIVNSKRNGKRITLSKSLSAALALESTIELIALPAEGVLLVSKAFPEGTALQCAIKGDSDESRICYRTDVVKALVKDFNLDFSTRTSRSYSNITIDKSGDVPVAIITLSSPIPVGGTENDASA